jgi:hypothetical protein
MITGQVARILNARELVINRGQTHGVERGMRFAVLDPKAEDIVDPETNEVLGTVNRPKVRLAVVQVEERMSVARTYERTPGRPGIASLSILGVSRALEGEPSRPITLRTDEEVWEQLDESSSYVKTGDPVQQITEHIPEEPK